MEPGSAQEHGFASPVEWDERTDRTGLDGSIMRCSGWSTFRMSLNQRYSLPIFAESLPPNSAPGSLQLSGPVHSLKVKKRKPFRSELAIERRLHGGKRCPPRIECEGERRRFER